MRNVDNCGRLSLVRIRGTFPASCGCQRETLCAICSTRQTFDGDSFIHALGVLLSPLWSALPVPSAPSTCQRPCYNCQTGCRFGFNWSTNSIFILRRVHCGTYAEPYLGCQETDELGTDKSHERSNSTSAFSMFLAARRLTFCCRTQRGGCDSTPASPAESFSFQRSRRRGESRP